MTAGIHIYHPWKFQSLDPARFFFIGVQSVADGSRHFTFSPFSIVKRKYFGHWLAESYETFYARSNELSPSFKFPRFGGEIVEFRNSGFFQKKYFRIFDDFLIGSYATFYARFNELSPSSKFPRFGGEIVEFRIFQKKIFSDFWWFSKCEHGRFVPLASLACLGLVLRLVLGFFEGA